MAYKPKFSSTATDFRVILKNVNYIMCGASVHDAAHDAAHDTSVINKQNLLLEFCVEPKNRDKILEMMIPDKPKSKNQKYITVRTK